MPLAAGDPRSSFQVDESFRKLLGGHSAEALENETSTVLGLWSDGRIALHNSAWQKFALENAGSDVIARWPLGSSLLAGISGDLRVYYGRAFERVLAERETWELTYACHSAVLQRKFRMRVLPLADRGLLLIHSLLVEVPFPTESASFHVAAAYVDLDGLIHQCSNCRRTQRTDASRAWDWVPQFIATPPSKTSHGICGTCKSQFYPGL